MASLDTASSSSSSSSSVKPRVRRTDNFFEEGKKLRAIVKHKILTKYLEGWSPKLCKNQYNFGEKRYTRIVYVDGFAGPGIHVEGNEFGSPTLAYQCLLKHTNLYPTTPNNPSPPKIYLIFIEKKEEYCSALLEQLLKLKEAHKDSRNVNMINFMVIHGEFARALEWVISAEFRFSEDVFQKIQKVPSQDFQCLTPKLRNECFITRNTPLFVFADPFGYSGKVMPMTLLQKTLESTTKAEFLINIMTGFLIRFLRDEFKKPAINLLFGSEDWKIKTNDPPEKMDMILKFYYQQLQGVERTKTTRFEMRNDKDHVVYHLMYISRNQKGFVLMKQSMTNVSDDKEFSFRFSEQKHNDIEFKEVDIGRLAKRIITHFKTEYPGQSIEGKMISDYIDQEPYLYQRFRNPLKQQFKQYCVSGPEVREFDQKVYDFSNYQIPEEVPETSTNLRPKKGRKRKSNEQLEAKRITNKKPSRSTRRKNVSNTKEK